MKKSGVFVMVLLVVLAAAGESMALRDAQQAVALLNGQMQNNGNSETKARLLCHRARNYLLLGDVTRAEDDYRQALETSYAGWIACEFAHFLLLQERFQEAAATAARVIRDAPHLAERARPLLERAHAGISSRELRENPPTIVMDTVVDPKRVTRHDLIRRLRAQQPPPVFTGASASQARAAKPPSPQIQKRPA